MARLVLVVVLALAGCSRSVRVQQQNPYPVEAGAYLGLLEATVSSLRDLGFVVDRQDHRFGEVTTLPLAAPTLLEPWHTSNTTPAQAADATINQQRRVVRVSLTPDRASWTPDHDAPGRPIGDIDGDGIEDLELPVTYGRYLLSVEVTIEQAQFPTRRLSGSTSGRNVMSRLRETPEEWRQRGISPQYWLAIGRDPALEQRLLRTILRRAAVEMESPAPAPG